MAKFYSLITSGMRPQIVPVSMDEVTDLRSLCIQTFAEAFAEQNTHENIEAYTRSAFNLEQLQLELKQENARWFFLILDNKKIGYTKLNLFRDSDENVVLDTMELQRIYILKKYHGNGYGKTFIEHAMSVAKTHNISTIWLGVWEDNLNALAFYKRCGFREYGSHIFQLGGDSQRDILMSTLVQ